MKQITFEELEANPRDFIFSDPQRCAPCRLLERAFDDFDFPWIEASWESTKFFEFREKHNLQFNGIPVVIQYINGFYQANHTNPTIYLANYILSLSMNKT
jgi:hypothetical protein